MNWYIVQAYSGFEKKVVESIKDILVKSKLESHLGEILVPTQEVTEVKKGKRTKKLKKYFPGYILVRLEMTKQVFHFFLFNFLAGAEGLEPTTSGFGDRRSTN